MSGVNSRARIGRRASETTRPAKLGRVAAAVAVAGWAIFSVLVSGCSNSAPPKPPEFTQADVPADDVLRGRIDRVLDLTHKRHMSVATNAAWQVMHGAICYGYDLTIKDPDGKLVSAIDYLLGGGTMTGWNLRPGSHGLKAILESGSKTGQGHQDQWLGYLALSPCELSIDQTIVVGKKTWKIADLVSQAKADCRQGQEHSWTLMGLSAYLPLDAEWENSQGEKWNFERLMAMEAAQNIAESPCGGTHRLVGLTVTLNRYLADYHKPGAPLTGGWKLANDKIEEFKRKSHELQQRGGNFSTSYYTRPADAPDAKLLIGTTGHVLEFLAFAMTDEELAQPWVAKAADSLCTVMEQTKDLDIECGALYHAASGLRIYRLRRFGPRETPYNGEPSRRSPSAAVAQGASGAPAETNAIPPIETPPLPTAPNLDAPAGDEPAAAIESPAGSAPAVAEKPAGATNPAPVETPEAPRPEPAPIDIPELPESAPAPNAGASLDAAEEEGPALLFPTDGSTL